MDLVFRNITIHNTSVFIAIEIGLKVFLHFKCIKNRYYILITDVVETYKQCFDIQDMLYWTGYSFCFFASVCWSVNRRKRRIKDRVMVIQRYAICSHIVLLLICLTVELVSMRTWKNIYFIYEFISTLEFVFDNRWGMSKI